MFLNFCRSSGENFGRGGFVYGFLYSVGVDIYKKRFYEPT